MNITVNVKECHPKILDKLMEDMKKLAGLDKTSSLQVNLEFFTDYPLEDS